MRKVNQVPQILHDLRTGVGAQRLPSVVRRIEVAGISARQKGQRKLAKSLLPRIRYNNDHVQVSVVYTEPAPTTGKAGGAQKGEADGTQQKEAAKKPDVVVRLDFDRLPSQEFPVAHTDPPTAVYQRILNRIRDVTGSDADVSGAIGQGPGAQTEAGPASQATQ